MLPYFYPNKAKDDYHSFRTMLKRPNLHRQLIDSLALSIGIPYERWLESTYEVCESVAALYGTRGVCSIWGHYTGYGYAKFAPKSDFCSHSWLALPGNVMADLTANIRLGLGPSIRVLSRDNQHYKDDYDAYAFNWYQKQHKPVAGGAIETEASDLIYLFPEYSDFYGGVRYVYRNQLDHFVGVYAKSLDPDIANRLTEYFRRKSILYRKYYSQVNGAFHDS